MFMPVVITCHSISFNYLCKVDVAEMCYDSLTLIKCMLCNNMNQETINLNVT